MSDLSEAEQALLALIRENPFAGQQQMADQLGLSRSAVAAHVVRLTEKGHILGRGYLLPQEGRVAVVGGAVIDRKYIARAPLIAGTSNPVEGMRSFGGVARNVAENLAALGAGVSFVSAVGADESGRDLARHLGARGIDVANLFQLPEERTAEYAAILEPGGDLAYGIADMAIFDRMTPELLANAAPSLAAARLVFVDCNLPAATLAALIEQRRAGRFELAIDAVSTPKVKKLPKDLSGVDLLFLNLDEASAYLESSFPRDINGMGKAAKALIEAGASAVILTSGALGAVVANGGAVNLVPVVEARPVDMTGAGDAMIAGTLHHYLHSGTLHEAVRRGALIAALTTESAASVHPQMSPHFVEANLHRLAPIEGEARV
ncbi:winged helix-turn-helix transcriptional regulator [Martelella mediterranea]|uniref:carbohydrate kinase n=1 Tax=Martelella mediterranea TaxID=293089 RepID=UPI001E54479F|nr:PfkB family carbohydrate kinase [Martelella mediterranea]MCD1632398.1 winged helix-turn-helix transcriptional regulator [Martelella mediterranea]